MKKMTKAAALALSTGILAPAAASAGDRDYVAFSAYYDRAYSSAGPTKEAAEANALAFCQQSTKNNVRGIIQYSCEKLNTISAVAPHFNRCAVIIQRTANPNTAPVVAFYAENAREAKVRAGTFMSRPTSAAWNNTMTTSFTLLCANPQDPKGLDRTDLGPDDLFKAYAQRSEPVDQQGNLLPPPPRTQSGPPSPPPNYVSPPPSVGDPDGPYLRCGLPYIYEISGAEINKLKSTFRYGVEPYTSTRTNPRDVKKSTENIFTGGAFAVQSHAPVTLRQQVYYELNTSSPFVHPRLLKPVKGTQETVARFERAGFRDCVISY